MNEGDSKFGNHSIFFVLFFFSHIDPLIEMKRRKKFVCEKERKSKREREREVTLSDTYNVMF